MQILQATSVSREDSEAVRSEARAVLLAIAASHYHELVKHLRKLDVSTKSSIVSICMLEIDEETCG